MKKAIIFLVDGFEEMEALVPLDMLMRADIEVKTVSITSNIQVTGSHDVKILADALIENAADDISAADMLILPGGPGASKYIECPALCSAFTAQNNKGGLIAAICAAPVTLGKLALLGDKTVTCYPGRVGDIICKTHKNESVITDGNITTGRAAGSAVDFGLELVRILAGSEGVEKVKGSMYL